MKIRITALDKIFSLCVRERSRWTCDECKNWYETRKQGLHCSHKYSRGKKGLRWHPDNAFAHCFACHQRLSSIPVIFAERIKASLNDKFDSIHLCSSAVVKFSDIERLEIKDFYKKENELQLEKKKDGVQGRLEFSCSPIILAHLTEHMARLQ